MQTIEKNQLLTLHREYSDDIKSLEEKVLKEFGFKPLRTNDPAFHELTKREQDLSRHFWSHKTVASEEALAEMYFDAFVDVVMKEAA